MTIIEQIKAEIERLMDEYKPIVGGVDETTGAHIVLAKLLSFLSTLESEKPMDGLEKEIKKYCSDYYNCNYPDQIQNGRCSPVMPHIVEAARHFAQWGAEHLASIGKTSPKDLEEAAKKHSCYDEDCEGAWYEPIVRNAFIAGAKWQAEQLLKSSPLPEDTVLFNKGVEEGKRLMMEGAVEGEVLDLGMNYLDLSLFDAEKIGVKEGDKVRIIIVKEDEK